MLQSNGNVSMQSITNMINYICFAAFGSVIIVDVYIGMTLDYVVF